MNVYHNTIVTHIYNDCHRIILTWLHMTMVTSPSVGRNHWLVAFPGLTRTHRCKTLACAMFMLYMSLRRRETIAADWLHAGYQARNSMCNICNYNNTVEGLRTFKNEQCRIPHHYWYTCSGHQNTP